MLIDFQYEVLGVKTIVWLKNIWILWDHIYRRLC